MPDQASAEPSTGQLNPAELAEALEDLSEQLAKVVPSTTDKNVRSVLTDCLERLRRIGSGLRAMALVVDPKRAQELAEREKDLRGLVGNIGESIRGVAEANRSVAVKMEDQVRELDEIVKLPPGEEVAQRLRKTVVTVRDAATSMEKSLQKLVTQVEDANNRIARLERELEEARERALFDALTRVHSRAALDERLLFRYFEDYPAVVLPLDPLHNLGNDLSNGEDVAVRKWRICGNLLQVKQLSDQSRHARALCHDFAQDLITFHRTVISL